MRDARVVEGSIQPTEGLNCVVNESPRMILDHEIRREVRRPSSCSTELRREVVGSGTVDVGDDDVGAGR